MSLFAPFYRAGASAAAEQGLPLPAQVQGTPPAVPPAEMEAMRHEIDSLRQQLAAARLTAIASSATPAHAEPAVHQPADEQAS